MDSNLAVFHCTSLHLTAPHCISLYLTVLSVPQEKKKDMNGVIMDEAYMAVVDLLQPEAEDYYSGSEPCGPMAAIWGEDY